MPDFGYSVVSAAGLTTQGLRAACGFRQSILVAQNNFSYPNKNITVKFVIMKGKLGVGGKGRI